MNNTTTRIINHDLNFDIKINDTITNLIVKKYNRALKLKNTKIETINLESSEFNNVIELPYTLKRFYVCGGIILDEINFIDTQLESLFFHPHKYKHRIILPQTLINLDFDSHSNFLNDAFILPNSLKELKLSISCHDIDKVDFNNCKLDKFIIQTDTNYDSHNINFKNINYESIKYLNISNTIFNINKFTNLEELHVKYFFLHFNQELNLANLKILNIECTKFNELLNLNKLLNLSLYCQSFNQTLNNLKNLELCNLNCNDFNMPLDNLSSKLTKLILKSTKFNQHLDLLPESLQYLELNLPTFTFKLDDLPGNIKSLILNLVDYNLELLNLPSSLIKLKTPSRFNKKIKIPHNLQELYLPSDYNLLTNIPDSLNLISDSRTIKCNNLINSECRICLISNYENMIKYYRNLQCNKKIKLYLLINGSFVLYENLVELYDI